MAGLWIQSLQYAFDEYGKPVPGAVASFYQAATLTALTVYQDAGLGVPVFGSEVRANARGQFPPVFLDDTVASSYRFRTTKPDGQILNDLVTLPINPGSSSGDGGGTAVDPTQLLTTGDTMWRPNVAPVGGRLGWVRSNSGTIGASGSSATEFKGPEAQALFTYLWTNFSNAKCPVTPGGRGLNAAADWGNNKAIATLDLRGSLVVGADKMGAVTTAGRITTASIALPDDMGSRGGAEKVTLSVAQLPAHLHAAGTLVAATEGAHTHGVGSFAVGNESGHTHSINPPSSATGATSVAHTHTIAGTTGGQSASHTHAYNVSDYSSATRTPGGSSTANIDMSATTGAASNDHTHAFSVTSGAATSTSHAHTIDIAPFASAAGSAHTHALSGASAAGSAHTHALSGSTATVGGGAVVVTLPPVVIGTWWMKL